MADLKPVTEISFAEIFLCSAFAACFAEVPLIFPDFDLKLCSFNSHLRVLLNLISGY